MRWSSFYMCLDGEQRANEVIPDRRRRSTICSGRRFLLLLAQAHIGTGGSSPHRGHELTTTKVGSSMRQARGGAAAPSLVGARLMVTTMAPPLAVQLLPGGGTTSPPVSTARWLLMGIKFVARCGGATLHGEDEMRLEKKRKRRNS